MFTQMIAQQKKRLITENQDGFLMVARDEGIRELECPGSMSGGNFHVPRDYPLGTLGLQVSLSRCFRLSLRHSLLYAHTQGPL